MSGLWLDYKFTKSYTFCKIVNLWHLYVTLILFHSFRLVPKTSDDVDYVYFHHARRCQSRVGRNRDKPGKHNVFVGGCDSHGRIIHEIQHILGKIIEFFIQNLVSNFIVKCNFMKKTYK